MEFRYQPLFIIDEPLLYTLIIEFIVYDLWKTKIFKTKIESTQKCTFLIFLKKVLDIFKKM